MVMNLLLRRCTVNDVDILRNFSMKTFYETFSHMNTPENMDAYLNQAFARDKILSELLNVSSSFYFLYSDNNLAGYLKLNEAPAQTEIHDACSMEIERIYVSKEYQGKKLGGHLMEAAINLSVQEKKQYIWLGVWEKNEKALCFYKRFGFYKIGTHSFFMGDDKQTDYIMRKDL